MRQRWLSRRAVLAHVAVLVVVPFCLLAGWWQLDRAQSGNTISWAYVIEWPLFAIVATVMWWQLVHDKRAPARERGDGDAALTPATHNVTPARLRDQEDPALQAYNDELELLTSFERRKTWRHPKGRP